MGGLQLPFGFQELQRIGVIPRLNGGLGITLIAGDLIVDLIQPALGRRFLCHDRGSFVLDLGIVLPCIPEILIQKLLRVFVLRSGEKIVDVCPHDIPES